MFYHASKQEFYQYYSATAIVDSDSKQERDRMKMKFRYLLTIRPAGGAV